MKYWALKLWAQDAGERALRTFAQASLATAAFTSEDLSIEAFLAWEPWSIGLGAAALSFLTSIAARKRGGHWEATLQKV